MRLSVVLARCLGAALVAAILADCSVGNIFQSNGGENGGAVSTGNGASNGASYVTSLRALTGRRLAGHANHGEDDDQIKGPGLQYLSPKAATELLSKSVATYDAESLEPKSALEPAVRQKREFSLSNQFLRDYTYDVGGATNGKQILSANGNGGNVEVYTLAGLVLASVTSTALFCSGAPPLPTCSSQNGGFPGDGRADYDNLSDRWIVTFHWFLGTAAATNVIAVSKTSDATGAWYVYQFPACGPNNTENAGDQPHTGLSDQWIVVTTAACPVGPDNIAVLDKGNLYKGGSLTYSANWFDFTDSLNYTNPIVSYVAPADALHTEYITSSAVNPSDNNAVLVLSTVTGSTDSPTYTSDKYYLDTGVQGSTQSIPSVDAPGCTAACISDWALGYVHSSGLFSLNGGSQCLLATFVLGDPLYSNATEIVDVEYSTVSHSVETLSLTGGTGSGPLSSQIAMPYKPATSFDEADIVYGMSNSGFYPGLKSVEWDLDNNSINQINFVLEGTYTTQTNRWLDFDSALTPIQGSSQLVYGGHVATNASDGTTDATSWGTISP